MMMKQSLPLLRSAIVDVRAVKPPLEAISLLAHSEGEKKKLYPLASSIGRRVSSRTLPCSPPGVSVPSRPSAVPFLLCGEKKNPRLF